MSDSEVKTDQTQTDTQNPSGVTAITVIRQGTKTQLLKDEKGKFVKKPRPLIPTIEFTRMERKALNKLSADGTMTEYMKAFMNMVRIAQYDGDDAKGMMAAAKAFEVLRLSALGKPSSSEQDLEKFTTQPVRVIVLQAPQLMHPEIEEEKPETKKDQPSFIDAEFKQN